MIAETLRVDRQDRNAAGVHDGWNDPANPDHAEPAVGRDATEVSPEPVKCNRPLYRVPLPGNVHGFRWVRCDRFVDEFGDCPECDR